MCKAEFSKNRKQDKPHEMGLGDMEGLEDTEGLEEMVVLLVEVMSFHGMEGYEKAFLIRPEDQNHEPMDPNSPDFGIAIGAKNERANEIKKEIDDLIAKIKGPIMVGIMRMDF